jgi:acetyl esterase/lipase
MSVLHPGAREYVERVLAAPPVWDVPLAEARRAVDAETPEVCGKVDHVAHVEDRHLAAGDGSRLRVRIYRPDAAGRLPAVVYFHGGGWVVGSIESHDPLCRALAARTPCVVVSVDYRLAPEHRFPAAVDDAWEATLWVAANAAEVGADPARIAVAGDSAGGNLAAVVALRARERGLPLALQVLIYPVIDHDLDSPGYREHGSGLNLSRAKMEWYWRQYLGDADGFDPDASPIRATEHAGLAPALVQTAEHDPLVSEGEAYARVLAQAGVPARLTRYDGQIHGFVRLAALCGRAANDAVEEIAAALRDLPGQNGDRLDLDQPVGADQA